MKDLKKEQNALKAEEYVWTQWVEQTRKLRGCHSECQRYVVGKSMYSVHLNWWQPSWITSGYYWQHWQQERYVHRVELPRKCKGSLEFRRYIVCKPINGLLPIEGLPSWIYYFRLLPTTLGVGTRCCPASWGTSELWVCHWTTRYMS